MWPKKEKEESPEVEVYRISGEAIARNGQRQCQNHVFRKLNETEVACTLCPTVLIVENANEIV